MNDHSPVEEQRPTFGRQIVELCEVLEKWRTKQKQIERDSLDEPPPFDWRAALYAAGYDIALVILFYAARRVPEPESISGKSLWFWLLWGTASLLIAAGMLQLIRAFGMHTSRFWRAHWREFRTSDNYPFTPLVRGLKIDFEARNILEPFSTEVIQTTYERLQLEESDLRERIVSLLGNPTLLGLIALLAPVWGAWRIYKDYAGNIVTTAILGASVLAVFLLVFGMRLRIALFELSRCRSLLSLELARRKHG